MTRIYMKKKRTGRENEKQAKASVAMAYRQASMAAKRHVSQQRHKAALIIEKHHNNILYYYSL